MNREACSFMCGTASFTGKAYKKSSATLAEDLFSLYREESGDQGGDNAADA